MTDKPTIHEALSLVMGSVQAVKKADRNTEQNYNFRGIDAVVNAVGPALREHGVLVTPELLEVGYRDVLTSRGKPSRECTVKVRYRFHGPAGDCLDVVVPGESMDFGDKGAAKAMSVAFRIALLQALAIPTDEPEHDPDASSYERAERREPSLKARDLYAQIGEAGTPDALRELWAATNAAGKAGEISAEEAATLRACITGRGENLAKAAPEPAEEPVEDRTAEPVAPARAEPDEKPACGDPYHRHNGPCEMYEPAEQQPMDGEWPEPARPGGSDPA